MLDVALKFLTDELNGFLLARTGTTFGEAELGKLVDDTGKWAVKEDHVGAALINVDEERILKAHMPETTVVSGRGMTREPPLRLNLQVLFAAHFKQYDVGLRYLAHVLTFFQAHQSFSHSDHPGLDARIERLSAELQSLTYEQLNQVWAFLGAKHLPSAVYRVRLVALQDAEPVASPPPVTAIATTVQAA